MKWSKAAAAATIAAMSVGLAACGGSSSDSSSGTLSRSALITKAEAICTKAQTDAKAIEAPSDLTDPTVAAAYFDKIAPITQTETDALVALEPANDVKDDYTAFTKAQTDANDLLQTIKKKADSKDASGLEDLKKVAGAGDAVSTAAKKLGAKTCG
jgi:cell fate (sporulation/competence/biofilm development) regulator YmcA (YheA/YmcA/DUF963 family)